MPPQFLTINDFRPGIVTHTVNNAAQDILDLPPGTASDRTYGCYALQTGALAPLPRLRTDLTQVLPIPAGVFDVAATVKPVGLFTMGPIGIQNAGFPFFTQNPIFRDELHLMVQGKTFGGGFAHSLYWICRELYKPVPIDVNPNVIAGGGPEYYGMTGTTTRMRRNAFTSPGRPTLAVEWQAAPLKIPSGEVDVWPSPTNPTLPVSDSFGFQGQVVALSGRLLVLQSQGYAHGDALAIFYTNEDITYTDPPNSNIFTTNQPTILDPDNPSGFMSWGSLVYGELVLIRRVGGAVVVDGDIYAPQVTILKGVKSVGDLMNVASASTSGLVYCVENDGAWIWEGGNSSRKISTVGDRFYDRPSGNPTWGVAVKHTRWGQFIAFPNGYLWDTNSEAWFRLVSFNGDPIFPGSMALVEAGKGNPDFLYCAEDAFIGNGPTTVFIWDRNAQTDHYTWWSQPIKLSDNMRVDVTEMVLSVTNIPTAGATIKVWLEDDTTIIPDPPTAVPSAQFDVHATTNDIGVQRLRKTTGMSNLMSCRVVISVAATNAADPAPSILSLAIAYEPRNILGQTMP